MRAVVATAQGPPDVLRVVEVEEPVPAPGELVVEVAAAGVNFIDTLVRRGLLLPQEPPFRLGSEGCGRVAAVGEGVEGAAVGDRVAWSGAAGSYAERAVVPASRAVPVPDGVGDDTAASLLAQGLTAHALAVSTHPVAAGETVVVLAAAGGVGLLLTQIAALRGGRVIAIVSSDEKAALAAGAGAAEVIVGYDGFAARVRDLTGGEGAHVVYDSVGRDTFEESLRSLRIRGLLASYGFSSGSPEALEPRRLGPLGSLYVTYVTSMHYAGDRESLLERASDLLRCVADDRLRVTIGGRYPLADAARAHADLEGRASHGKLLLVP